MSPIATAGNRCAERHARVHHRQRTGAYAGLRCGSVGADALGHRPYRVRKLRSRRAAPASTHALQAHHVRFRGGLLLLIITRFSHRIRRHVVVVHIPFKFFLISQPVDTLPVADSAKRRNRHGLRFAPRVNTALPCVLAKHACLHTRSAGFRSCCASVRAECRLLIILVAYDLFTQMHTARCQYPFSLLGIFLREMRHVRRPSFLSVRSLTYTC